MYRAIFFCSRDFWRISRSIVARGNVRIQQISPNLDSFVASGSLHRNILISEYNTHIEMNYYTTHQKENQYISIAMMSGIIRGTQGRPCLLGLLCYLYKLYTQLEKSAGSSRIFPPQSRELILRDDTIVRKLRR